MTTKKIHYYVLVITNAGPVFVTSKDNSSKTAYWNKDEKPLELSKTVAEDLALGLNLNMHKAYVVSLPWEEENQPYCYSLGEFEWKEKSKKKEEG